MTIYNTSNSGLPNNDIRALAIDSSGNIWIGTYGGGVAKFDGSSGWTVYNNSNTNQKLPNDFINTIAIYGSDIWVGTLEPHNLLGGIACYIGNSWSNIHITNPVDDRIFSIIIDTNGYRWIGYAGGFVKFIGTNNWTHYPIDSKLGGAPYNHIMAQYIDGQDIWVGTMGGGLAKFNMSSFIWEVYNSHYTPGWPNNCNYITSIIKDDVSGKFWIGTLGGGLIEFWFSGTKANWMIYDTSNSGLPDIFVLSIAVDTSNNIWIGTRYGGLAKFDVLTQNWFVYKKSYLCLPDNWITSIVFQTIQGTTNIWIGTKNGGLVKI